MLARPLLHPSWLPACHLCRQSISSSSRRLPSSEILSVESTASCTSSAFQRPVDGGAFPIGSLGPAGLSTNIEPRSNSSGTDIVRITKDIKGGVGDGERNSRSGTVDRGTGTGSRLQNSRPTTTRPFDQVRRSTSSASGHIQQSCSSGTGEDFLPSSTVVLRGVGTAVLEVDIRRLIPRKIYIPEFRDDSGVVRVIPFRDIQSLDRRPIYHIIFAQPWAAVKFAGSMTSTFSELQRSQWPDARFPPGSWPVFSSLDARDSSLAEQETVLQGVLSTGGSAAGRCVLLTTCGIGGRTRSTGRLPRTQDIREILEESEIELCPRDIEEGGAGVQRLIQAKFTKSGDRVVVKADGRGLGAEGRWLIRCSSESEAHRVVRELHMRAAWEGGGIFRTEVIY